MVGGYAVIEYSEPRYTKDLDLWIQASPKNAKAIFSALTLFGAPVSMLTPADFSEEGYFFQMGLAPLRIDILMSLKGISFDQAWKNRTTRLLFGENANFISHRDLIKTKDASGRPQDLLDAEALRQSLATQKKLLPSKKKKTRTKKI